jgi:hypothetical protein
MPPRMPPLRDSSFFFHFHCGYRFSINFSLAPTHLLRSITLPEESHLTRALSRRAKLTLTCHARKYAHSAKFAESPPARLTSSVFPFNNFTYCFTFVFLDVNNSFLFFLSSYSVTHLPHLNPTIVSHCTAETDPCESPSCKPLLSTINF